MNFWQGKICPVCKIEFSEKDDVVYCHECGTAHHRSCWNESGACFFAPEHKSGNFETINELAAPSNIYKSEHAIHEHNVHEHAVIGGTDENKQIICGFCGYHNNPIFRVCISCGHELSAPNPEFKSTPNYPPPPGFNSYNDSDSVNDDDIKLADDISRADMARFYGNNSEAAMGCFKQISQGKLAFSGSAFAGSFFWLLYHKVIGAGLAVALAVMSPLLTLYGIICVKCADDLMAATNTITDYNAYMTEQYRIINEFMLANMSTVNICLTLTGILFLASMVFCGFFGMKLYYNKAVKTIRLIRQRSYDRYQREYLFTVKGGVNFLAVLLPVALYFFASSLVAYVCLIFG